MSAERPTAQEYADKALSLLRASDDEKVGMRGDRWVAQAQVLATLALAERTRELTQQVVTLETTLGRRSW